LGAPFAMTAIDSIADSGSDAKLATFDMNADAVTALQDGDIQFIVDQQPYLQGFLAVESARLYHDNGNVMGGGKAVRTGPQIITPEDADAVAEYARSGPRQEGTTGMTPHTPVRQPPDERVASASVFTKIFTKPEVGAAAAAIVLFVM